MRKVKCEVEGGLSAYHAGFGGWPRTLHTVFYGHVQPITNRLLEPICSSIYPVFMFQVSTLFRATSFDDRDD